MRRPSPVLLSRTSRPQKSGARELHLRATTDGAAAYAEADYVIVDTPPSGLLSDAASLSEWADGVIYVVRQDYVAKSAVLNSAYALNGMEVRFIGCVLNQTARTTSSSGYGYSSHKGSGYGYGYGYGYAYGNGYSRRKYGSKDGESTGNYQK